MQVSCETSWSSIMIQITIVRSPAFFPQQYDCGNRVRVLRSSGRWDGGWTIVSTTDGGYVCVANDERGLEKFISKGEAPTHITPEA